MTDFTISCDTFVRLCGALGDFPANANEWFNAVRIDGGCAVASNRRFIAVERVAAQVGVVHIINDPALVEQCRKEAAFNSVLTITVNEALQYAVAKTTLGYVHPTNCAVWSSAVNDLDKWRAIVATAGNAKQSNGALFMDVHLLGRIASCAPSGCIVFEQFIDTAKPVILRDTTDYDWFAIFNPFSDDHKSYPPAELPSWFQP